MISLAEDVRDIAGWPAIEWGMTEEEVREALTGRVSPITPIAKFANSYAPIKGSVTLEGYPFEVLPQFSHATGELCQVLFRAADAEAERIAQISELLTACYGSPVEGETKRTWWGPATAVELDTVKLSPREEQSWLRWYPIPGTEVDSMLDDPLPVYPCEPGTYGPGEADDVIARHGGLVRSGAGKERPPR